MPRGEPRDFHSPEEEEEEAEEDVHSPEEAEAEEAEEEEAEEEAEEAEWYVIANGQQDGPVRASDLRRLWRASQLGENPHVWREDMDAWAPMELVPQLL